MILFNQNDDYDRKQQLEYLNDLPQYKLFRLKSVPDQMKTYDFYNEKCIIEFKKRTCNHDTFPDFILQKDKFDTNLDIATRNNISFYYQNKFNNGKIWEWDMTDMAAKNCLPKLIEKEMNRYTYVPNPEKISKRVYMLKLSEGYEI
tara:strand:- start:163 stop:600 length:438 start_codon:yes stop_codon:yes gene_type:complete